MKTRDNAIVLYDLSEDRYIVCATKHDSGKPVFGMITECAVDAADAYTEIWRGEPAENLDGNISAEYAYAILNEFYENPKIQCGLIEIANTNSPSLIGISAFARATSSVPWATPCNQDLRED